MKILHVIETLAMGGAERLLVMLLPELKRRGEDVAVAVLKPPLPLKDDLEAAGVPVHLLPAHHKWNLLAGPANVARKAEELGSDIVHAHLYFPSVYTGLARMRGLCRARTVVTFHNLAYQPGANKPGLALLVRRHLQAGVTRRGFDGMIANSEPVSQHYRCALRLDAVSVLHNPVDLAAIDRAAAMFGPPGDDARPRPLHIVLPGRLVHEKGHLDLIEALTLLRDQGHPVRATFAGGGPFGETIEAALHRTGLAHDVTVTGVLPHDDLLATIAAADIVVVPSRFEGFGLTALEAMALSRPLIVSNAGGLKDVVDDGVTGLIVPPAAPAALADAIARLAADPALREALAHAGRTRAEAHFTLARFTDALQAYYRDVLECSKPGLNEKRVYS